MARPAERGGWRLSPAIQAALACWGRGKALAVLLTEMVARSWAACFRHPPPSHLLQPDPFSFSTLVPDPCCADSLGRGRHRGAGGQCSAVLWAVAVTGTYSKKPGGMAPFWSPPIIQPGCAPSVPPELSDLCFWGLGEKGFARAI